MKDVLNFDFGEIQIHDNYIIAIINEGITITPAYNEILLNVVETYYKNKKFAYITNRINSYAVDPSIYFETSKIKNLVGFAVVSKDFKAKSNAEIEKLFFDKPYEVFNEVEDAIAWANSLIES